MAASSLLKTVAVHLKRIKIMTNIEEKITAEAMERAHKGDQTNEEIMKWANDQLALVTLWQRTGVKPDGLELGSI